jgi:cell division protein FtsA
VDIGGGTTDLAVFTDGAIRHTSVIPIAGDQVTNDIAVALRTPTQHAEQIKVRHACALSAKGGNETIEVPSIGERPARQLSRQTLAEVVEPRFDELLSLLQGELRRSGFEDLVAGGVVLTGGSAKMDGLQELAEELFHMPVRIGLPQGVTGLEDTIADPAYSTGVGLLIYAQQHRFASRADLGAGAGLWGRMRKWFSGGD